MGSYSAENLSNTAIQRSVVLAGGAASGTAWMIGLVAELKRLGIDFGNAELIVGTSGGALAGAMLATGRDLDVLAVASRFPGGAEAPMPTNLTLMSESLAILSGRVRDRTAARRRLGRHAKAERQASPAQIDQIAALVGGDAWPDTTLRIVAVDAETGQRRVLDAASGVPMAQAVAASRALPGRYPPVVIDGRHYLDGGLWSFTSADVADAAGEVLVIDPLANGFPREQLQAELDDLGAESVVHFSADQAAIDAFGTSLSVWDSAFAAGARQATVLAGRLDPRVWTRPKQAAQIATS
ncbi:patatin-like phospholipase family protein [Nocardia sp. NBC_01377]